MRRVLWSSLLVFCLVATPRGQTGLFLPAGTLLQCTLDEPKLSSRTVEVGDPFICHVGFVRTFGRTAFPRGAYLAGHFEDYRDPGHFFGKGWIQIEFDRLVLPTGPVPLSAKIISVPNYMVDTEGRIHGNGHPARDAIGWVIPILWPIKVITLPMRGPRPTLKGETRLRLRLLEDLDTSSPSSLWMPIPSESRQRSEISTPSELRQRSEISRSLYPGYSFNLLGTNIARSDAGATIQMVGSGSFDPAQKTIAANGSFVQLNSDGSMAATGTWEARDFLSFIAFGGPNQKLLGGVLELTVTLLPMAGAPQTGVPMSVTCLLNPPRGFTGEEGITIGFFINKVRGKTAFHMSP